MTTDKKPEKPSLEEESERTKPQNPFDLLHPVSFPFAHKKANPMLLDGRTDIDKPLVMRLKENLEISLNVHCREIGQSKSAWVREAILRRMEDEQRYFIEEAEKKAKE